MELSASDAVAFARDGGEAVRKASPLSNCLASFSDAVTSCWSPGRLRYGRSFHVFPLCRAFHVINFINLNLDTCTRCF